MRDEENTKLGGTYLHTRLRKARQDHFNTPLFKRIYGDLQGTGCFRDDIMKIKYKAGDATRPDGGGNKVIVHCVNDIGQWGSGFVLAVSRRWKEAEIQYRRWHRGDWTEEPFELGRVQFVEVEEGLWVANLIGQHRNIQAGEKKPIRYDAMREGMARVRKFCSEHKCSAHMPRIGADRARGDWTVLEKVIEENLCEYGIQTSVYDLRVQP